MTRISPGKTRSLSDRWLKISKSTVSDSSFGIKILYQPAVTEVDIVFIHGITGHREGTWTASTSDGPWPRTLLMLSIPQARIMTFGYDAAVVGRWNNISGNRIGHHARNLLSALATQRAESGSNTDYPQRPLIFVAHSLGGLIVKDALLMSRSSPELHLREILESTRGIVFLGTPHAGTDLATVAERCVRAAAMLVGEAKTNSKIVQVLRRDSEVLDRIQYDFHELLRTQLLLKITCFYEELAMPGVGLVVPRASAILPGYTAIGIHQHHRDIARFACPNDPGFISIVGELRRFVAECQQNALDDKEVHTGPQTEGAMAQGLSHMQLQGQFARGASGGPSGVTIWGNVHDSIITSGPQTITGDIVFGR